MLRRGLVRLRRLHQRPRLPADRPAPATAVLRPLAFSMPSGLAGYGALVSPRAGTVMATLSDGTAEHITPVTVGGRGYVALALPSGTTLTRLTLEDRSGHTFATVTSIPPAG